MGNSIAVAERRQFAPAEIRDISEAIAISGLFGIKTPQQAFALALIADAEGLHPATIAQDYDVIQGRPARKTHSVLARFQAAGGRVDWRTFTEQCVCGVFTHPSGGSVEVEWTIDMAKRAGLASKDNWRNYPRAMLRSRCIGEGVRAVYPAALGGALLVEEAQDMDPVTVDADTGTVTGGAPAADKSMKVGRKKAPKDVTDVEPSTEPAGVQQEAPPAEPPAPAAEPPRAAPAPAPAPRPAAAPAASGDFVGAGEQAYLRNKAASLDLELADVLADMGGLVLERLTKDDFAAVKAELFRRGS